MENITLNITSERYPVIEQLAEMAVMERRSMAVMADILLTEAIDARKVKDQDGDGSGDGPPIK